MAPAALDPPLLGVADGGDPALQRSFRGHKDGVTGVAFAPNMKQLVSSSLDQHVMVWHFKPQLRAYKFQGHKGQVLSLAFSRSGALIASGSKDRTVRVWQPTVEGRSTVIKAHTGAVRTVAHEHAPLPMAATTKRDQLQL